MKVNNFVQEFIVEEDRPFDSAHASTLLQLRNGGVLAAWFGGSWEHAKDVAIWTARRVGGRWLPPVKVADVRGVPMWNPVLFRRADGTIELFFKVGEEISDWQTFFVLSRDEGETFSAMEELVPGDTCGGRGPVKNKPIRLKSGRVLAPASLEGPLWDAFVDISDDDCRTWRMSELVPIRRVQLSDGSSMNNEVVDRPYNPQYCFGKGLIQPTLWEDENGVHMLCRSTSSRVFRSDSCDGGETWRLAYDMGLPNNNSGLDLAQLSDGRLVLAYNPRENLPGYYKGPRTPLVVAVSCDNGETFETVKVLEDQPGNYCYPSIIVGENDEIMVAYTWNRLRVAYCSFTLD